MGLAARAKNHYILPEQLEGVASALVALAAVSLLLDLAINTTPAEAMTPMGSSTWNGRTENDLF